MNDKPWSLFLPSYDPKCGELPDVVAIDNKDTAFRVLDRATIARKPYLVAILFRTYFL